MGTTIEKLNYLNETKGLFKDRLNSLGGNVTENTKFRDYLTWVDNFYNEVDDHTLLNNKGLEGETEQAAITYDAGKEVENTNIEINDLDNDRENYITLKGNTEQFSTTGKNLYNNNVPSDINKTRCTVSYEEEKINVTATGTDIYIGNYLGVGTSYTNSMGQLIEVEPNTTYTLLVTNSLFNKNFINYYNSSKVVSKQVSAMGSNIKTFTTDNDTKYITLRIGYGEAVSGTTYELNIQLEKGSTATTYEPYTGGNPSPNPDYPQPVNVVSGRQEVVVCGNNFCNYDNNTDYSLYYLNSDGGWTNGNSNTINQRIGITSKTISIYIGSKSGNAYIRLGQFKNDGTFISRTLINQSTNNITLNNDCSYIWLSTNKDSTNYFTNVSVVYGTSVSSYEAYTGQNYEINLGEQLADFSTMQAGSTNTTCSWQDDILTVSATTGTYSRSSMAITNIIKNNPGKTLRLDFDSYDFSQGAEPNVNLQIINKNQITYFNLVNMSGQISNYTIPNNTSDITMVLLRVMSNNTATSQASSVSITKPILHFGDTKISYTPYFTPIELCGIGDYKDRIFKGSGVNLLSNNNITQTIDGITFTKNDNGSITLSGTSNAVTDYYLVGSASEYVDLGLSTGTYNLNGVSNGSLSTYMLYAVVNRSGTLSYYQSTNATGLNISIQNGDMFRIFIRVLNGQTPNTTIYPQLNEGSTALPYEPYNSKGKWLLHKEIGKVVLNGSESWTRLNASGGSKYRFRTNVSDIQQNVSSVGFSNYFTNNGDSWSNNGISGGGDSNIYIRYTDLFTQISDLTTWLSTHNTMVYYVLATPDTIDITDETLITQLDALYTAEMSNGINYINTNTENVLPYIDLKYNMITTPRPNPEHPVDIETINGHQTVQMHGKNLLGLRNGTYTTTDVTATVENGEIVLNGTAGAVRFINITLNTKLDLEIGQNYTTSMNNGVANGDIRLRIDDSGNFDTILSDVNTTKTFTYASSNLYGTSIKIRVASGTTLTNFKLKPMIEKGTTASQYEAYTSKNYDIDLNGKNLFDISTANYTYKCTLSNEVYTTNSLTTSDRSVNFGYSANNNYTIYPNETYYISADIRLVSGTAKNVNVLSMNSGGTRPMITNPDFTNEFQRYLSSYTNNTESPKVLGRLLFQPVNANLDNAVFEIKNVMISKSSDINYAPYFTPIELCKINDYKDSIRKGYGKNINSSVLEVGTISNGENMENYSTVRTKDYIEVKPNTNYAFSVNGTLNRVVVSLYDINKNYIATSIPDGLVSTTGLFTTFTNAYYIRYRAYNADKNLFQTGNIQLEEGNQATPYEPYHHADKWYIEKQIGKVVLDGSESWETQYSGDVHGWRTTIDNLKQTTQTSQSSYVISNYYESKSQDDNFRDTYGISNRANQSQIIIKNNDITNRDNFTSWLSTHNTIVYYVLATPTTTEITDSALINQLEAIQSDLIKYKVSKELILDYDTPELEYLK